MEKSEIEEKLYTFKSHEENVENLYDRIESFINGIEYDIEIRIESIKIELDEIQVNILQNVDKFHSKIRTTRSKILNLAVRDTDIIKSEKRLKRLNRFCSYLKKKANHSTVKLLPPTYLIRNLDLSLASTKIGIISYPEEICDPEFIKRKILNLNKYIIIQNMFHTSSICEYLDGNLIISSWSSRCLFITDKSFNGITKIDLPFSPLALIVNENKDVFIISNTNDSLNKFNSKLDLKDSTVLKRPGGIFCTNDCIYVTSVDEEKIVKYDFDLKLQAEYPLEYRPKKIVILNNVCCVKASDYGRIQFYELNPFKFIRESRNARSSSIGVIGSNFYEYTTNRLYCYKHDGDVLFHISTPELRRKPEPSDYGGIVFVAGKIVFFSETSSNLYMI